MNVKDFVRESLQQIVAGVHEAQKNVEGTGAIINPSIHIRNVTNHKVATSTGSNRLYDSADNLPIESVSFDLAVTVEEGSKSEDSANGGAAIRVMGMGFGAGVSTSDSNESKRSSVSRLKFNILVKLPASTSATA
jgi:hypothetical protein